MEFQRIDLPDLLLPQARHLKLLKMQEGWCACGPGLLACLDGRRRRLQSSVKTNGPMGCFFGLHMALDGRSPQCGVELSGHDACERHVPCPARWALLGLGLYLTTGHLGQR